MTDPIRDALGGGERTLLEEITTETGGLIFFPGNIKDTSDCVEQLASLMRHGYQIGLNRASFPIADKHHKLTVKLSPNNSNKGELGHYSVKAPAGLRASN